MQTLDECSQPAMKVSGWRPPGASYSCASCCPTGFSATDEGIYRISVLSLFPLKREPLPQEGQFINPSQSRKRKSTRPPPKAASKHGRRADNIRLAKPNEISKAPAKAPSHSKFSKSVRHATGAKATVFPVALRSLLCKNSPSFYPHSSITPKGKP